MATLTIGGTSAELGAFSTGNLQLALVVVWGYLLTTATMALLLGAAVAEAHTASAETARLAAIVEATSDLVGIADPQGRVLSLKFEQVVVNLAVNARDAMPDGGRLVLQTDRVETAGGPDSAHPGVPAGRWVRLTVTDDGVGMSEDVQRRTFEPFFTTKPIGQGTGLGLAMVHGIVTQHGGCITCDSPPNEGTVFRIYLPEAPGSAERPA